MADNFGLKLGIDGEKEFKKTLSEINRSFKVLGSEMQFVSSQFNKSGEKAEDIKGKMTDFEKLKKEKEKGVLIV